MEISVAIDYWSEGVLCFDPEKVVTKLIDVFPTLEVDPTDWAEVEVQKVAGNLQPSDAAASVKETMLRQIRGKARRNGPVFNFKLVTDEGSVLTGRANRYSVAVRSASSINAECQRRLVALFESFKAGTVTIDVDD